MGCEHSLVAGNHRICYKWIRKEWIKPSQPVMVFVHEGLGCIGKWKDFPETLSNRVSLPAFVYERYGYGHSEPLKEPRQPDYIQREALQVLPEILEKTGIHNRLILVGHSDGGSIALMYASKFPHNVISLILEAPHVMVEKMSMDGLKAAVWAYEHGDLRERLEKYHGENTDSMFRGWANLWMDERSRTWNIESFLPGIISPVLFIQGEEDEYGSVKQLYAIKKGTSGPVEDFIIPGCGHIPHQQAEEKVLKRMKEFIQRYR